MDATEVIETIPQFDWTNYLSFGILISLSAAIGIYFGCFGSKQSTTEEYLHGGRRMNVIPIGLSLVATNIAGITLIILPSEVYTHNAMYILYCPAMIIALIVCSYFFLPVFFHLDIANSYEYLELRFSKATRNVASGIYVLSSLLYLPFIVYIPALTFSQVTGINVYIISTGVTIVCIFYTAIGGLKAFVWSDFFQTIVLIIVTVAIVIVGTINAGGIEHVLMVASKGRLLDIFDMNLDPFIRNTFWTISIGSITDTLLAVIAQQDSIQRFKALPTMRDVNIVLVIYWFGITGMTLISIYCGIMVFSVYFGCNPLERGVVEEADQIFPYYILDKIGYLYSVPGIFIAGVLCGGLSALAATLNTLGGSIYHDYIKKEGSSEKKDNICMKIIVVIMGIYAVASIPIIEKMGTLLAVLYQIDSITAAPCLSFFILGMMTPWCNAIGAISGAFTSMIFLTWMTIGSSLYGVNDAAGVIYPGVTNTCNTTVYETPFNFTLVDNAPPEGEDVFLLYKLSFMHYSTLGTIINILVSLAVSYFTGNQNLKEINPNLISPPLRKFLPEAEVVQDIIPRENENELKVLTNENMVAKAEL